MKEPREWGLVVMSFALIFAFSTVDSAVAPLVHPVSRQFGVTPERALYLISWCTAGTVGGVLVGPALTASFPVARLLAAGVGGLLIGLAGFLGTADFGLALACRLVGGSAAGLLASCLWWLTFYGVSRPFYQAMMTVLMSARPLATAIGVPLAAVGAARLTWQAPFWGGFAAILAAGGLLAWLMGTRPDGEKKPFALGAIVADYGAALRVPLAMPYYLGFTVNRMCYFGFYALSGIWFAGHYGVTGEALALALFVIGLAEAAVNFVVPGLVRRWGHGPAFLGSLAGSGVLLPVFLSGRLEYGWALAAITVFMMLDRVYCMAVVLTIPRMFPQAQNMTVFGSLNTLTAWAGLSLASWLEGRYLPTAGLPAVEFGLLTCFLAGSGLILYVQWRTVLGRSPEAG